jgi:hypothetical protein
MRLTSVATIIAAYEIAFWARSVDYALSSLSAAKIQQFEVGTGCCSWTRNWGEI